MDSSLVELFMSVAVKKPLTLVNRTVYFDPSKDRLYNTFQSNKTYYFRKQRIEGYESRLYWQFRYCNSIGCPVFFYTLTYNDYNVPYKYGTRCFDYEDLRSFLTGGFRKQLLRKYGLTFKYFVGAELGDGKGKRGFHNNPHYHILFFLEPANNPDFPLKSLNPKDFRTLVRLYWQGFDQEMGFKDFRKACLYGIAKEGENLGLVTDYRACFYCAKYVCKDVKLSMKELQIPKLLYNQIKYELMESSCFHRSFLKEIVYPLYSFDSSVSEESLADLISRLIPSLTDFFNLVFKDAEKIRLFGLDQTIVFETKLICEKENLWKQYYKYLNDQISVEIDKKVKEWRNRYSNKVRISQGVGDYALNFMDFYDPKIMVPSKKGFRFRTPCLYYYRKMFTGMCRPLEVTFNGKMYNTDPVRVLNLVGMDYKVHCLQSRLDKLAEKSRCSFELLMKDKSLFDRMVSSDVNVDVLFDYRYMLDKYNSLDEPNELYKRYAEYKLVYQYRYFLFDSETAKFPDISISDDYRRFLVPSVFSVSRSDLRISDFLKNDRDDYMSYDFHPYFLRYLSLFRVLGLLEDYFFICKDDQDQEEAERRDEIRRFHLINKMCDV